MAPRSWSTSRRTAPRVELDASLHLRGKAKPRTLDDVVVSLDAVCDRTGGVVSLPVTVDHRQRRFDVRALIDLGTVFAGLDAEDRALRLRLRAVWNNASWETTLARPEGGAPPFELSYAADGTLTMIARQGREA